MAAVSTARPAVHLAGDAQLARLRTAHTRPWASSLCSVLAHADGRTLCNVYCTGLALLRQFQVFDGLAMETFAVSVEL
ncbi:hypothetical protein EXIGLDRAFT_847855 [Exidia glandulosa HHB12029]|uniref:Uncharacterized protein n=1 Tax=Exidia glandulosa HHB12029 TaxID=1314781 RepID=A0A166MGX4_EXIGL|nr:hypothetical protein EXIGLDRAFT_847855 [Exidia glandulosa HHB12029]